jgi:hypothetical protein
MVVLGGTSYERGTHVVGYSRNPFALRCVVGRVLKCVVVGYVVVGMCG